MAIDSFDHAATHGRISTRSYGIVAWAIGPIPSAERPAPSPVMPRARTGEHTLNSRLVRTVRIERPRAASGVSSPPRGRAEPGAGVHARRDSIEDHPGEHQASSRAGTSCAGTRAAGRHLSSTLRGAGPSQSTVRSTGRGMLEVLWNVDSQDSLGDTNYLGIERDVIAGLPPGSIILMHEITARPSVRCRRSSQRWFGADCMRSPSPGLIRADPP